MIWNVTKTVLLLTFIGLPVLAGGLYVAAVVLEPDRERSEPVLGVKVRR